ncbi:MAG: hypothetical protein A2Z34_01610 [Planctomycetes bacterium RBG_16_59_8]|nr:MAG: hypothetical protein A2Z34_01610 [Planctomycetes bacterium RBG_16_59_8]
MRFEKDFEGFLRSLNEHDVRYCIIGAFAVGFHGYPRYTKDIDILIKSSRENAEKVAQALRSFGIKAATSLMKTSSFPDGSFNSVMNPYESIS